MRWPQWMRCRWPWRRDNPDRAALDDAQARLDSARQRQPEVTRLAAQLREIRERNNFAELIASAFREHR